LGLAIAKQLVELHGGSIRAESDGLGAGTCFTVSLPVSTAGRNDSFQTPAFAAESKPAALAKGIRLNDVRVLVVDDDNDSRLMLAQLLMRSGATVSDAASAAEAIASIPDFAPDVLVSDLGMPRQDGYELIKAIRGRGYSFQSLPAIALTAFVRPEDRQRALLAGFQVHIAKPVDPSEFLAAIATLVGRTGS
jgi:CheY-like chemotaxis protein